MIPASSIQFLREEQSDKMDKPASVPMLTLPCANTDDLSKDQVNQKENDKTASEPTMISDDRSKDQVNQTEKDKTASEPMLLLPTPYEELETAHTLTEMMTQIESQLELQKPLPQDITNTAFFGDRQTTNSGT